jgi:hypothetical protein
MIHAYDFLTYYAPAEGNKYLNDLFWVIYDRLAKFTQMGEYSMSSAERGVALTESPRRTSLRSLCPSPALRCRSVRR